MTRKLTLLPVVLFLFWSHLHAQWQPVRMPSSAFNSLAFVQDSVLLVCLNQFFPQPKKTLRSADFGQSWSALPDSLAEYDYTFKEADGLIYAHSGPQTIYSTDGGITWSRLHLSNFPTNLNNVAFRNDTAFWGDSYGNILRYFPDGSRDTVFDDPDNRFTYLLDRLDYRLIRAAASSVSYSDDGGNNWQYATGIPDMSNLSITDMRIARLGGRVFMLVQTGQNDLLLQSDDLGSSWQVNTFFESDGCDKIRLWATAQAVYILTGCMGQSGYSPSLQWRMSVQDDTWQMFDPPLKDLYMIGETPAALVGAYSWEGTLYRSADQGAHWDAITPDYGRISDARPFFHWPDGRSLVSGIEGWHVKTDDAALYRILPQVDNNCFEQAIQRGDSVFWSCSSLYYGVCFTPDRGETWDTLVPVSYIGYQKIEKFIWAQTGIFAQIANPPSNIRQLGRWSFDQNDWTDLIDFPDGVVDWARAGDKWFALTDQPGSTKIFVFNATGGVWNLIDNLPPSANITRLESGGDALFAIGGGNDLVFKTNNAGQTWDELPTIYPVATGWPVAPTKILTASDGLLLAKADVYFLFSEDGGYNWILLNDPVNLPNLNPEILRIGPDEQVYVASNNNSVLLRRPTADFRKLVANAHLLLDVNGNGVADAGDTPAGNIPVSSSARIALTNPTGMAAVGLRPDLLEDTLRVNVNFPNFSVLPAFLPVNDPGSTYTFLLTPDSARYLEVRIQSCQPPRPGFAARYQIQVANYGIQPESGRLKFVPDPRMQWLNGMPVPDATAGDTLYWQINKLAPLQVFQTTATFHLSPAAPLGDAVQLFAAMELGSSASGWTLAGADSLSEIIVGSFDPNDKLVSPPGNLDPQVVMDGLELTYTVRFQNTGTYAAENVLVTDTLPAQLDARTFRLLGASHPCQVRLKASNVLEFYFETIQLPDSNANESASHGFVRFSVRPFANLPLGTAIRNSADIYFDFNQPVRTNVALNTVLLRERDISSAAVTPLQCHPNPAYKEVWVDWPEQKNALVRLYRWDGALLESFPLQPYGKNRLDIGHLPAGMYSLQAVCGGRVYGGRFVKM